MDFHRSIVAAALLAASMSGIADAQTAAAPAAPPIAATPCTAPAEAEDIVVCGRGEDARYRLPTPDGFDPRGLVDSVSRERNRLMDVGASGIQSCSTVGPGGWTGCDVRRWRHAHEQRAGISQEQPNAVSFGPVSIGAIRR